MTLTGYGASGIAWPNHADITGAPCGTAGSRFPDNPLQQRPVAMASELVLARDKLVIDQLVSCALILRPGVFKQLVP